MINHNPKGHRCLQDYGIYNPLIPIKHQQVRNMTEKNGPKFEIRSGAMKVTAWENERKRQDGSTYTATSFVLTKSYKDEDADEWKETKNLSLNDLPRASVLLSRAFEKEIISQDR